MSEDNLPSELIKKLKDTAKQHVQSSDVVLSDERREYRNLVLTAHANIENLLGLLIGAYFTRKNPDIDTLEHLDVLLEYVDYGTKISILKDFGWVKDKESEKILSKAIEIAKYRNAVVHLRRRDPRRLATEENIEKIKELEEAVEDKLLLAIVGKDIRMFEPMQKAVTEYLAEFQQERFEELKKKVLKKRTEKD